MLIDGHMRIRAATEARIVRVPFVREEFDDETAALHHAVNLQTKRRRTTDGALYRLCEQFDRLLGRGGDRKSEGAKSIAPHGAIDEKQRKSARRTAQLIGCNFRKVERIRKIRNDGTPEIQEDVSNDRMSINKTYKLIRDMELGIEEKGEKLSAAQIKAVKTLFTEENFTALQELDGNLHSLVNLAIEQFISGLRGKGHAGNK